MVRVLIVEDDILVSTALADQLESVGYSVDMAENGVAAYGRFRERNFDMVVTDFEMPFSNGASLIDMIRHGTHNSQVPIVIMSGRVQRQIALDGVEVQAFMQKPFTGAELAEVVSRLLQKSVAEPERMPH
jgi:DNA-binding response OmpR family regulator